MGSGQCKQGVERNLDEWKQAAAASHKKEKKKKKRKEKVKGGQQVDDEVATKKVLLLGASLAGKSTLLKCVSWDEQAAAVYTAEHVLLLLRLQLKEAFAHVVTYIAQLDGGASARLGPFADELAAPVDDRSVDRLLGAKQEDAAWFFERLPFLRGELVRRAADFYSAPVEVLLAAETLRACTDERLQRLRAGQSSRLDGKLSRVRTTGIVERFVHVTGTRTLPSFDDDGAGTRTLPSFDGAGTRTLPSFDGAGTLGGWQWQQTEQDVVFLDVGGPRSERRKWIHCFQSCNVMFMVSAVGAFRRLYECHDVTYWQESATLLGHISASPLLGRPARLGLMLSHIDEFYALLQAPAVRDEAAQLGVSPQQPFYLNLLRLLLLLHRCTDSAAAASPPHVYAANLLADAYPNECAMHFAQHATATADFLRDAADAPHQSPAIFRPPPAEQIFTPAQLGVYASRSSLLHLSELALLRRPRTVCPHLLASVDARLTWQQAPYLKWAAAAYRRQSVASVMAELTATFAQLDQPSIDR